MKELDEKGFVFLSQNGQPYRCCMWGDSAWLFSWNSHHQWVAIRKLTQMDVWQLPHNLTEEEQQHYHDLNQKALDEIIPHFKENK